MAQKKRQKEEQFVIPGSRHVGSEPVPSSKTAALVEKIIGTAGSCWAQNLLIFLAVISAYGHTLTYPFYFDDFTSIVDNQAIQDLGNFKTLWNYAPLRVIGYATFALNYHFHGLHVFGYHLLNIFIHTLTGCAILFTLLFSLLAIFTKQNSATLPLAFILIELIFFRLSPTKLLRGIFILTLSVSTLYLTAIFILHYQPFSLNAMEALTRETKAISRIAYLATQTRVLWTYIRLFFLPTGLHIDHDMPISQGFSDIPVIIATGGHILLLLLAWKFARRQPLLSFGEIEQAQGYLSKALTIWPDYSKAHNNIGLLYVKEKNMETAIKHLKAAVAIEPDYENAHNNLGYAYHEKRDWKLAESHYREALRLKPDSIKAHNNLARLLADRGNVSEAIFHLEESLRIEPDYAVGQHNIGQMYAQQEDLERAIKHFSEAIRINPAYAKAFYNLGLAYARKGDSDLAAKNFKKALEVNPEYKEAEMSLNLLRQDSKIKQE